MNMILWSLAVGWEPMIFMVKRYRRCPSNRVLVVYGKVGGSKTARCIHGGGVMVWPVIQDYVYMSLEPMTIEIAAAVMRSSRRQRSMRESAGETTSERNSPGSRFCRSRHSSR